MSWLVFYYTGNTFLLAKVYSSAKSKNNIHKGNDAADNRWMNAFIPIFPNQLNYRKAGIFKLAAKNGCCLMCKLPP